MDKKQLSETDIRTKFITPALVQAGWDLQNQINKPDSLISVNFKPDKVGAIIINFHFSYP